MHHSSEELRRAQQIQTSPSARGWPGANYIIPGTLVGLRSSHLPLDFLAAHSVTYRPFTSLPPAELGWSSGALSPRWKDPDAQSGLADTRETYTDLPQELNVWQLCSASLRAPRGPGTFHQRSSQTHSDHGTC